MKAEVLHQILLTTSMLWTMRAYLIIGSFKALLNKVNTVISSFLFLQQVLWHL
jgi:hypothetical protein